MNVTARCLFVLARWLMPPARREWVEAMRAEASYLHGRGSLRWALGCACAALKERLEMDTGNFRISRWVMLIETLGCFGFLALAWFNISFGALGLLRHDWGSVTRNYLPYAGGTFILSILVLGCVVGLVGPIGLFLGFRYVLSGRGLSNRWLTIALLAGPLLFAVVATAGYFVGPPDWHGNVALGVMCVLLPVVGIAHLAWLAKPVAPARPVGGAGLAAT